MDFFITTDPFRENKRYFTNQLSEFVFYSKYSRWNERFGRREVWSETVDRAVGFLRELSESRLDDETYAEIRNAILRMEVMPSMRLMAMAGEAARRENVCTYNCSFLPLDAIVSFVEIMYLSMNGVGVGFSVEKQFVDMLPRIESQHVSPRGTRLFVIPDSTEGWCDAFGIGLNAWFNGNDVTFDFSRIRPAGAPLKTKGGTSSGKRPLIELFEFARSKILANQGKKLEPIDVYDIATKIADCVVMGGVRRSSAICLFDANDTQMLNAKNGNWWETHSWRANANNSVVWNGELRREEIAEYFDVMHDGRNGEPGFFSRYAVQNTLPSRRDGNHVFGVNPCGEAILRSGSGDESGDESGGGGLCNLSQVVARPGDTLKALERKARLAAIIGTIQSTATDFHYLRDGWKRNAEEERLLGVDITGIFDSEAARSWSNQMVLKHAVISANVECARTLGIKPSVATTLVKPSGNSGTLLNVSSGVHPRWSEFYRRNVRVNVDSPLYEVVRRSGMPMVQESEKTFVIGFAVRSPRGSIVRSDLDAKAHLAYWKQVKECYAEHSVSMTCYYSEDEMDYVKQWIYQNQGMATGLSFLPRDDTCYANAPYEEISEKEYYELVDAEPRIDFGVLNEIEASDHTTASHEVACSAGQCDLQM